MWPYVSNSTSSATSGRGGKQISGHGVAGLNNGAVVAVDAMLFSLSGAEGNLLDKMEMERMGRETYIGRGKLEKMELYRFFYKYLRA